MDHIGCEDFDNPFYYEFHSSLVYSHLDLDDLLSLSTKFGAEQMEHMEIKREESESNLESPAPTSCEK